MNILTSIFVLLAVGSTIIILAGLGFVVYRHIRQSTCSHKRKTRIDNGPWPGYMGTWRCVDCGKELNPLFD